MKKYGFVYIWYDTKKKMFYVGSHWGREEDGYICSSKRMRDNHRNRPNTFKRKIIGKRIYTNRSDLLEEEQRWLNMISKKEFGKKYYNISSSSKKGTWWTNEETKKQVGDKISNAKKGKQVAWNKGKSMSEETKEKLRLAAKKQWQIMDEKTKENCINNLQQGGWNKGLTKEDDPRIKAPSTVFKKGHIPWHKGKKTGIKTKGTTGMKFSNETREKMRQAALARNNGG